MTISDVFEVGDIARRKSWAKGIFIKTINSKFFNSKNLKCELELDHILAKDWEPFEPEITKEEAIKAIYDIKYYLDSVGVKGNSVNCLVKYIEQYDN